MMGSLDRNPRPAWAITCWISDDERHIYVELPMAAGGVPYIMEFDGDTKGLLQALRILKARRREVELPTRDRPANYTPPANQPMVKQVGRFAAQRNKLYAETTEEQRIAADKLLMKLGIKT